MDKKNHLQEDKALKTNFWSQNQESLCRLTWHPEAMAHYG